MSGKDLSYELLSISQGVGLHCEFNPRNHSKVLRDDDNISFSRYAFLTLYKIGTPSLITCLGTYCHCVLMHALREGTWCHTDFYW
jgi:hypothetical protein